MRFRFYRIRNSLAGARRNSEPAPVSAAPLTNLHPRSSGRNGGVGFVPVAPSRGYGDESVELSLRNPRVRRRGLGNRACRRAVAHGSRGRPRCSRTVPCGAGPDLGGLPGSCAPRLPPMPRSRHRWSASTACPINSFRWKHRRRACSSPSIRMTRSSSSAGSSSSSAGAAPPHPAVPSWAPRDECHSTGPPMQSDLRFPQEHGAEPRGHAQQPDSGPIGVFDSGVGGLSVWREIVQRAASRGHDLLPTSSKSRRSPGRDEIRGFCERDQPLPARARLQGARRRRQHRVRGRAQAPARGLSARCRRSAWSRR